MYESRDSNRFHLDWPAENLLGVNDSDEVANVAGIGPLIVKPSNQLEKVSIESP